MPDLHAMFDSSRKGPPGRALSQKQTTFSDACADSLALRLGACLPTCTAPAQTQSVALAMASRTVAPGASPLS
jgi:hypothetical protein